VFVLGKFFHGIYDICEYVSEITHRVVKKHQGQIVKFTVQNCAVFALGSMSYSTSPNELCTVKCSTQVAYNLLYKY
jgi:hypothetical protein